jgi:hypothetical protein
MVGMLTRINNVNSLVATLETILDKREQHAILFVVTREKSTDVTFFAELGAGKGNGWGLLHCVLSHDGSLIANGA